MRPEIPFEAPVRAPSRLVATTFALLLFAGCGSAAAQLVQFRPPGDFGERPESMAALLDEAIGTARWRFGRLYLDPWLAVRDVAYYDNVAGRREGEEISDVTVTLGLGLRGYVPLGSGWTLAAHSLPEYVWWEALDGRRRWNGRHGLGLIGEAGPVRIELSGTRREYSTFISDEIQEPGNFGEDRGRLALDVALFGPLSVFGSADRRESAFLDDRGGPPDVGRLDRRESTLRAGFRWALGRGWQLGLGLESIGTTFDEPRTRLNNDGTGPVLELTFERRDLEIWLDLGRRDLEATGASAFPTFDQLTGNLGSTWRLGSLKIQLGGSSDLVYAIGEEFAYYRRRKLGLGTSVSLTSDLALRVFAETGDNTYRALDPSTRERRDDVTAFGAGLKLRIGRARLRVSASRSEYDSSVAGGDRQVTRVTAGLSFGSAVSPWG